MYLLPGLEVENVVLIHMYAAIIHDIFIVNTDYPYLYKHNFVEQINMKRDNILKCNMKTLWPMYIIGKRFLDVSIYYLHYKFELPNLENIDVIIS